MSKINLSLARNLGCPTIDIHTHTGLDTDLAAETERKHIASTVQDLLEIMDKSGTDISITFNQPPLSGKHKEVNERLNNDIEQFGQRRILQFAYLNAWDKTSAEVLEKFLQKKKVHGLKLHPLFDKYPEFKVLSAETIPLFDVAKQYKIPILCHTGWGVPVSVVIELAKEYKDTPIIVGHMLEDVFPCHPFGNMYVDTSYASHPRRIRQIVEKLGSERVLFGSDNKWNNQLVEKMKILELPLPTKDLENILYKNAQRIVPDLNKKYLR